MAGDIDLLGDYRARHSGDGQFWQMTLAKLASIPEMRARAQQQQQQMQLQQQRVQQGQQQIDLRSQEIGMQQQQMAQQQQQATAAQEAKAKAAKMAQDVQVIVSKYMKPGPNGGVILDTEPLFGELMQQGIPPEAFMPHMETIAKLNEGAEKSEKQRMGHVENLLDSVVEAKGNPAAVKLLTAYGKTNGWLRDAEIQQIFEHSGTPEETVATAKQILTSIRGRKEAKTATVAPGAALVNTETGEPIFTAPKPEVPQRPVSVSPGGTIVDPATGKVIFKAPAAPTGGGAGPHIGSAEDYIRRKYGANPTPDQVLQGRKEFSQADDPDKSAKPPTGAQNKALGFFNRAKQADENLEGIEKEIASLGYLGQQRLKRAPNVLQTEAGQSYDQAQRQFIEAYLRRDSGAQIKDSEYDEARRTYFVEPGDSEAKIAQKRRARAAILAGIAAEAGSTALRGFYGDEGDSIVQSYRARGAAKDDETNPFRKPK